MKFLSIMHQLNLRSVSILLMLAFCFVISAGEAVAALAGCPVGTPGWGMAPPFDAQASYWNPIANTVQDSTESHPDCGGAWNDACQGQPTINLDSSQSSQVAVVKPQTCDVGQTVSGEERGFHLNGLTFRCFVPDSIINGAAAENVWILDMPSTKNGSMHDEPSGLIPLLHSPEYAYCTYDLNNQGLRPMNTVIRGYWALGVYLTRTWADQVDKFVLTGGSFGSATAVITPMMIGNDPEFPLAGVWSAAGLEGQRYFDLLELVKFTSSLLSPRRQKPLGQDQEIFSTFFKSIGAQWFSAVDVMQLAQYWSVPWWMNMGDEDITTHADTDTADLQQAFINAGNESLLKVFVTQYGSHTGDGFLKPIFLGDNSDPYNGQTPEGIDYLCRDVPLFVQTEVLGKPLPVRQVFPIANPSLVEYDPLITAQLNPDLTQTASGPNPALLSFNRRLGYGSQLAHDDSLVVMDPAQGTGSDLIFGNFEGEVQRLTVDGGNLTPVWNQPTRLAYRIHGLLPVNNQLFAMTVDGTAALLNPVDGNIVMKTNSGHLGTHPRRPVLATAYAADGTPRELIFVVNRQSQVIGIDPLTLQKIYQNDRLGTIQDWGVASDDTGIESLWMGLLRGHALRLKMVLPDCVEVVAVSPYFDDLPTEITVLGEYVLVSGEKNQYMYDGAGVLLPPPPGGAYFSDSQGIAITPSIWALTNDPSLAMWVNDKQVGLTDITQLPGATTAVAPITEAITQLEMLSLRQHGNQIYATTGNGTLVKLSIIAGELQATPLNTPTSAISSGLDQTAGDLILLDDLEQTGVSLLRVDFENPAAPVSIIGSGYDSTAQPQVNRFQWGMLEWRDEQEVYLIHEGARADIGGQRWTFAARLTSQDNDLTFGHLLGFQPHMELPTSVPGSVKLLTPQLTLTEKNYGKVTNEMVLDPNRGAAMHIAPAGDDYDVYYAGSYGVERRRINGVNGDQIGAVVSSGDLGWRMAGLAMGVHRERAVLFAGSWLSHQEHTGHTYVLKPDTLAVQKVLDTGIGSWGIAQADVDGDSQPDTIIGTFTNVQVYDHNLQLLHRTAPLTTAFGAHNSIIPLANGQPCFWRTQQASNCIVDELALGSSGGVIIYDVTQAGGQ